MPIKSITTLFFCCVIGVKIQTLAAVNPNIVSLHNLPVNQSIALIVEFHCKGDDLALVCFERFGRLMQL